MADDYGDFYDGSWDDEANDRDESGANGPDTSVAANHPWTGCKHNGTASLALGQNNVRLGRPNSAGSSNGPINGNSIATNSGTRPMYGVSELFQGWRHRCPRRPHRAEGHCGQRDGDRPVVDGARRQRWR